MATPPTFTAGNVLTAAQMNAVGLWLVKSQTIGSAVSSVTVTGAFSSDFDNYRIVIYVDQASISGDLLIRFGSTTTAYYGSLYYDSFDGLSTGFVRSNNASQLVIGLTETINRTFTSFDVGNPYDSEETMIHGTWTGRAFQGWHGGKLANTTSYTAFTILNSSGTLTGGTIRVYGYRD